MKHISIFFLALLLTTAATAQTVSVTGVVADKNSGTTLANASAMLIHLPDSSISGTVSNKTGAFSIDNVQKGRYLFVVKFLGYKSDTTRLTIAAKDVNVGRILLEEEDIDLKAVEVTGIIAPATVKGDTTEYNASAYKVNKDATAEDLVTKVPGVTVEAGKVKAQGEEVKQTLVDGRPFFGSDPTAALRAIPAELVDRVQIFDQMSEQSRFTGFDDGNTSKTINLVTRSNMRNGIFGKFFGGYGADKEYKIGTTTNILNDDTRLTVLAQSNNVNEQNFAIEDIVGASGGGGGGGGMFSTVAGAMGGGAARQLFQIGRGGGGPGGGDMGSFLVTPSGGISTTHAVGLNYSDRWADNMEVSGSYFFNRGKNESVSDLVRQYELSNLSGLPAGLDLTGINQLYNESATTSTTNTNHRFNMRFEWNLDTMNSIILRPRFSAQQSDGSSLTLGRTSIGSTEINSSSVKRATDLLGTNFNTEFMYRHRFEARGRTFIVGGNAGYTSNTGSADNHAFTSNMGDMGTVFDSLDQVADLDKKGWSINGNVSYTEPISEKSIIQLTYNASKSNDESDKTTNNFDPLTGRYTALDTALTNTFSNSYVTQSVEGSYRLQEEGFNASVGVAYQMADLTGDQKFPYVADLSRSYRDILPNAQFRYRITRDKNLFLNYRTRTSAPSVDNLQNVLDNTNPLLLRIGNPDLQQNYSHNLNLRFMSTNFGAGTYFFGMLGGSYTLNSVVNSTFIAATDTTVNNIRLLRGVQLTRPINMDGAWSVRAMATYGFPMRLIGSNINLSGFFNLSRTPGMVNDVENFSTTPSVGGIVTIASNISQDLDFTISSFSTQSWVRNSMRSNLNTDYFMQNTRLRLNWIFWEGFLLSSDLTHTYNSGLSSGYNTNTVMWNVGIGKKFLANNAAELRLTVFDILNQNQNVSRSTTEAYIEDLRTNILQRYALLTFTYTLRSFGGERKVSEPERERGFEHGPPPPGR